MLNFSLMLAVELKTFLIIIGCSILGLVILAAIFTILIPAVKKKNDKMVNDVVEHKNVRYTENQEVIDENGEMKISLNVKDIILKQGATYVVGKDKDLKPGKYTVLGSAESEEKFNIRTGLYVKEYAHNQEIILAEGDEISPVSTNIILR